MMQNTGGFMGGQVGATAPFMIKIQFGTPFPYEKCTLFIVTLTQFFSLIKLFQSKISFSLKTNTYFPLRVQSFSRAFNALIIHCALYTFSLSCPSLNFELDPHLLKIQNFTGLICRLTKTIISMMLENAVD